MQFLICVRGYGPRARRSPRSLHLPRLLHRCHPHYPLRSDSNVEPDINLKPGTNWKEDTFGDGGATSPAIDPSEFCRDVRATASVEGRALIELRDSVRDAVDCKVTAGNVERGGTRPP
jgi:hypothetical protein